jgi:DNA-binding response OmpR family regulator
MALNRFVMVIDDDPSIREFITMALHAEGYKVLAASDGEEALQILQENRPVLILLDIRMPTMDGPTFVRRYHATLPPHAPIVVLTAGKTTSSAPLNVEVDGFLAKPFDLDELLALVAGYVTQQ